MSALLAPSVNRTSDWHGTSGGRRSRPARVGVYGMPASNAHPRRDPFHDSTGQFAVRA